MVLCGLTAILIGCGNTKQLEQLRTASVEKAVAAAPTRLPPAPAYCTDEMPTVDPVSGEKTRWTQKRWEIVRANEITRDRWCWGTFYKGVANHAAGVANVTH
jgi:hypothetical protein